MIKFKEHDGLLFKMLDKPVSLTPDAEMPCLVRLIQDDSPMGKRNKDLHGYDPERLTPRICTEVINRGSIRYDRFISCEYYHYELIGTHVKEGSDKWALYQMMQGNKVRHESYSMPKVHCAMNEKRQIAIFTTPSSMIDGGDVICHANDWLTSRQVDAMIDERTGWQIYHEPKPEPIFTTGDKVTDGVIEGTIIHIEDAIADVCPSTDEYKIELRNLNHIPESPKQDDVEKPLRSMIAEAKAIGKNIRTYYQDIVFTPQALEACLNQGKFRWWNICNWELTTREQNYFPSISTSSDRPKPESENIIHGHIPADMRPEYFHLCKFKVGDWVECNGNQCLIEVIGRDLGRGNYYHFAHGNGGAYANSITRKLKPGEVVVKIGCLSGTVEDLSYEENGRFWLRGKVTERYPAGMYAILYDEMLDTKTREIVEGLLKAQEEG